MENTEYKAGDKVIVKARWYDYHQNGKDVLYPYDYTVDSDDPVVEMETIVLGYKYNSKVSIYIYFSEGYETVIDEGNVEEKAWHIPVKKHYSPSFRTQTFAKTSNVLL